MVVEAVERVIFPDDRRSMEKLSRGFLSNLLRLFNRRPHGAGDVLTAISMVSNREQVSASHELFNCELEVLFLVPRFALGHPPSW